MNEGGGGGAGKRDRDEKWRVSRASRVKVDAPKCTRTYLIRHGAIGVKGFVCVLVA